MTMSHVKQVVLARAFTGFERLGVHILPTHYYSPVANRKWMAENPELWQQRYDMGWDLDQQIEWLRTTCATHLDEVAGFSFIEAGEQRGIRFRYGQIEGQALHCVVRRLAPRRIVEVGSGASTFISSTASDRNAAESRQASAITAIDPYAPVQLERLGNVTVERVPVQEVPLDHFTSLEAGDILFLDSTHALHAASELPGLYLKILPALTPGVIVHIHDIFLPWMYRPSIMKDAWDWQETALLAALLTGNPGLEVLCCQSALHDSRVEGLKEVFPDYVPKKLDNGLENGGEGHFPSSLWMTAR
jgi:predicted O-methyltransferase YrrM